jgi:hypothetical protein
MRQKQTDRAPTRIYPGIRRSHSRPAITRPEALKIYAYGKLAGSAISPRPAGNFAHHLHSGDSAMPPDEDFREFGYRTGPVSGSFLTCLSISR